MKQALVLWFTGLSGAGKTTIADEVSRILKEKGKTVITLDGDVLRSTVHHHLTFSREDIKKNNDMIANICIDKIDEYDYILVPIISPFTASRKKARDLIGNNFIEVYVKASLNKVIERDIKGLYKKAIKGVLNNFIGIDPQVP